jgi:hypothetical protein
MFTNIKTYLERQNDLENNDKVDKNEMGKICTAEFDTLEFAQSISSTTRTIVQPPKSLLNISQINTTIQTQQTIAQQLQLQTLEQSAGAIKHYRKFNLNDLKPKHNIYRRTKKVKSIKRNNNQRPQRTKKNN